MLTLKEQIKTTWLFATVVALFFLFVILERTGVWDNNIIMGILYLLMGPTMYYSTYQSGKIYKRKGYNIGSLPIYATGVLTGMWIFQAFELLFR